MRKESYEFLKTIAETPSPSGFEQPVQRVVRTRMERYAHRIETDVQGNVAIALNPDATPRVMLAGHCDQIGLMVNFIDDQGYIFVRAIGGIDPSVVPGSRVVIHSGHGPVDGVIGRRPIHVLKPEERGSKIELRELWVDIGAKSRKEVAQVVSVGDPITFRLELVHLGDNLITAPALDNKCGVFVVMEALRLCATKKLRCALSAVSTVQEEVGLRGVKTACFGLDPHVGIAVDVTHATDYPDIDKRANGDVKLGAGPTISVGANFNPPLAAMFRRTAQLKKIAFQTEADPGGSATDANAMQLSRSGVATALISIPSRYMHTQVEIVSLDDLNTAAKWIAETVQRIQPGSDFTPQ